jgi:hypothetical protein
MLINRQLIVQYYHAEWRDWLKILGATMEGELSGHHFGPLRERRLKSPFGWSNFACQQDLEALENVQLQVARRQHFWLKIRAESAVKRKLILFSSSSLRRALPPEIINSIWNDYFVTLLLEQIRRDEPWVLHHLQVPCD